MPRLSAATKFLLLQQGVWIETVSELPKNRVAQACMPGLGEIGAVGVQVLDGLKSRRKEWALWHESAHILDMTKRVEETRDCPSVRLRTLPVLSEWLKEVLWEHSEFLCWCEGVPDLAFTVDGKKVPIEKFYRNPKNVASLDSETRERIKPLTEAFFKLKGYRIQTRELFANAVACAIRRPKYMERGAPGLLAEVKKACRGSGLPIEAIARKKSMRGFRDDAIVTEESWDGKKMRIPNAWERVSKKVKQEKS